MNRPTEACSWPSFDDLSLNCVIRLASPNPVMQLTAPRRARRARARGSARTACTGPGRARRRAAGRRPPWSARVSRTGILRHGDRVQVDHAVERVVGVLQRHPLAQRARGSCRGGTSRRWAGCRTGREAEGTWRWSLSAARCSRAGIGDDHLDPLELLQVGVASRGHGAAQRPDQVHRAVRRRSTGRAGSAPACRWCRRCTRRAARQFGVVGLAAPVVAAARRLARRGRAASRPSPRPRRMASALAMSPLLVIDPSAITCTYRPPDSSR